LKTENLSTLKIHKLTQEQYDRAAEAGILDESALYLTPDEEINFPVDSVNGKTGDVVLSASDVGARPNTWMPTASDVGAAPSSHNHAASNITSGTLSADRLPTVPIKKGGLGGTDRLSSAKNLTNEAVSSPNYVVSLTNSWGKFGYTSLAQLMTALGAASATPSVSSANNSYHTAYFAKIGKLVICTLVLKSLGVNVYSESITVPPGYRPSTAQSFTTYSDTAHWQASGSNVSNGGGIAVKVATGGKLSINDGGGYNYNTNEMNITLCWATS
jgi:hypothetical protein